MSFRQSINQRMDFSFTSSVSHVQSLRSIRLGRVLMKRYFTGVLLFFFMPLLLILCKIDSNSKLIVLWKMKEFFPLLLFPSSSFLREPGCVHNLQSTTFYPGRSDVLTSLESKS